MELNELHSMTVVELRKLAKESGVKLGAGNEKEGIVQRLFAALGEPKREEADVADEARAQAAPAKADEPEEPAALQQAALSADVTSVPPPSAWKEGEASRSAGYYRPAWQSRTPAPPKQPLRQPTWQPPQRAMGGVTRFGPQTNYAAPAPRPAEAPRPTEPVAPQPQPVAPRVPENAPRLDGYRLGFRAAPQRQDVGRTEYQRGGYRPQRPDFQPRYPSYDRGYQSQSAGYQPAQPQGYAAPRASEAYYNDALYKPTRDPAFAEPFDRGQPAPDLLQASEGEPASGVLEILPDGYGFLRGDTLLPGRKDIYVSVAQIRRYNLRTGDCVEGKARAQRDCDKFAALLVVEKLNGHEPVENPDRLSFETLVPIYPNRRIKLESERNSDNWPIRMLDLIAPIGFGQRAMIVATPGSGKPVHLREISKAVRQNDPDAHVMMLLIDERPEEVTEIREAVDAEVFASTFDEAPESQTRVSETMLERAERLVEEGRNVVILLDSLTKLTRAYQATLTQGGRALTNTVTPAALVRPKRFFGAARNTRDGGSLTVIATIMVDTGSRVDDIIFEEFKGTANMEVWLDAPEGENEPMFPVVNLSKSGTKKEDMLLTDQEKESLRAIRTVLGSTTNREALVQLIDMMSKTKNNDDLFHRLKDWVALWEKSGFLSRK